MSHIGPTKHVRRQTFPRRPLPASLSKLGGHLRWLSQSHTLRPERSLSFWPPNSAPSDATGPLSSVTLANIPICPFCPSHVVPVKPRCSKCVRIVSYLTPSSAALFCSHRRSCCSLQEEMSIAVASRLKVRALPRYRRQWQPALPRPAHPHPIHQTPLRPDPSSLCCIGSPPSKALRSVCYLP